MVLGCAHCGVLINSGSSKTMFCGSLGFFSEYSPPVQTDLNSQDPISRIQDPKHFTTEASSSQSSMSSSKTIKKSYIRLCCSCFMIKARAENNIRSQIIMCYACNNRTTTHKMTQTPGSQRSSRYSASMHSMHSSSTGTLRPIPCSQ